MLLEGTSHLCFCQSDGSVFTKGLGLNQLLFVGKQPLCWLWRYVKTSDWKSTSLYQEEHSPPRWWWWRGASVCLFLSEVYGSGLENRGPQVSKLSPSVDGLHNQFLDEPLSHANVKHAQTLSNEKGVLQIKRFPTCGSCLIPSGRAAQKTDPHLSLHVWILMKCCPVMLWVQWKA